MPRRIRPETYLVECFRRQMGQDGDGDPIEYLLWLDDHLPVPDVGVHVEVRRRSKIPPTWVLQHNRGRGTPDRNVDEDADDDDAPAVVARWEGPEVAYLREAVVERRFWDKVWRGTLAADGTTTLPTCVTSIGVFSDHVPESSVIRDERVVAGRRFLVAQIPRAGSYEVAHTHLVGSHRYDLGGVIYHLGTAHGGHYVCCLRCGDDGAWWLTDDMVHAAPAPWTPPTWHHDATMAVTAWPHVVLYRIAGEPWPAPPDRNLVNGSGHDCFVNAMMQLLRTIVAPQARVRPFVHATAVTFHDRKKNIALSRKTG